jgi:anthranilate phosphoribosyltransferase
MRTSTAFVLALSLATVSTAAFAQDDSAATCATTGKQVSTALGSTDNEAARQEKKTGLEFCNAGYYHQGMAHYAKALELLGVKN